MIKRVLNGRKLPSHIALAAILSAIVLTAATEWHLLNNLDHPKPHKIRCLSCHSDKRTLEAMADKADDPLYLVHDGQLTLAQLNKLMGKAQNPGSAKPASLACPVAKSKPVNQKSW